MSLLFAQVCQLISLCSSPCRSRPAGCSPCPESWRCRWGRTPATDRWRPASARRAGERWRPRPPRSCSSRGRSSAAPRRDNCTPRSTGRELPPAVRVRQPWCGVTGSLWRSSSGFCGEEKFILLCQLYFSIFSHQWLVSAARPATPVPFCWALGSKLQGGTGTVSSTTLEGNEGIRSTSVATSTTCCVVLCLTTLPRATAS